MVVDMSQFYQVFFEETAELLAEMEQLLLGLDAGAPDLDDINAIFRVAHSVKGGSSTLGFGDMAEVTHALETLLDRVRREELPLREEMIDAFLQAGDVVKAQMTAHQGGDEADLEDAGRMCALLKQLSQPLPAAEIACAQDSLSRAYRIEIDDAHGGAAGLEALCNALATLGSVQRDEMPEVLSDAYCRELLAALDLPELAGGKAGRQAPQHHRLRLVTAADEEQIREGLAFFVQPQQLRIAPEAGRGSNPQSVPWAEEEGQSGTADPSYGFFEETEQPAPPQEANSPGRRATDNPESNAVRSGRRSADKHPVAAQGDASSIRVGVEKVDQLINLVGELVITQAMLEQTVAQPDSIAFEQLRNGMAQLERNTRDLQEAVMSIRMMPIGFVFSRFPRMVRDISAKLVKQVQLRTYGEGTELDKGLIEKIADPLTHLVRNSLDHGIELPARRITGGKEPAGTITLRASHQGGNIVIEVADDGAGLNRERILAKAAERGLPLAEGLSDQEVWQLIFAPGFSTAEVVTDVSGRGVGMDVVKRNIESLNGRVEIDSAPNRGTRITIRLPLTLAILDGMSIAVGEDIFIVPLTVIAECLQPRPEDVRTITGQGRVVQVRGEYLPLIALHEAFNIVPKATEPQQGILVILEVDGRRAALFVDGLVGQHQVVIKSLESNYRKMPGISGATIMGDGKVALILDVAVLARLSQG